jgi:hypothetical protein
VIAGGFKVQRGHCSRCATAGRPLYTLQVEPGRQPYLKEAKPGDPDNAVCEACWQKVADVITIQFAVSAG